VERILRFRYRSGRAQNRGFRRERALCVDFRVGQFNRLDDLRVSGCGEWAGGRERKDGRLEQVLDRGESCR